VRAIRLCLVVAALTAACGPGADAVPGIEYRRDPDSVELIETLRRGDADTRARAVRAMGRIQSAAYTEPIVEVLTDPDAEVRRAAWFALGQLGLARGIELPPSAVAAALDALDSSSPETVALAAEALGKLADPSATERLVALLEHADPAVRVEAAHALLRLRFVPTWRGDVDEPPPLPATAVEALAGALTDEDARVREAAAHALSRYGEPAAAAALAAVADDPDPWVRLFAVRGVGRADARDQAQPITWGFDDPDLHVRAETVSSMAALGEAARVPPALDADPSFHVRAAVAAAMAGLADEASLARLRRLAGDASPTVRGAAVRALAERLGAGYADELASWLGDERWTIRVAVVGAAGTVGEPALGIVLRAAEDADPRVRTAALGALAAFQDREEVQGRIDAALAADDLGERASAVEIIADSDRPDRVERLAEAYDRSSGVAWVELRESIVDAAADIPGAVDLLRRAATDDPASSVRAGARRALRAAGHDVPEPNAGVGDSLVTRREAFGEDPVVVLETPKGTIEIRTFADDAPVHVSNFVKLVREGFYDGLIWHRVVPNFVIQGGDPLGSGWGGPGYAIPDEINRRRFERGTLGMPKAGKDTGGCQLFITHVPTPHLDGNYTVFGQVTSGLEVVDRLEVGDTIDRAYLR